MNKSLKTKDLSQQARSLLLDGLLSWSDYDDAMRRAIAPILYSLINETGKSAIAEVGLDPSQFNPTALDILNYNQQRAAKIATDVNDETEKQIRASISQGLDAGEGLDELQARVEDVMGSAATFRSDRISRTETTRAQGFADNAAWKQSGVVSGKEWYCVIDERTCIWCLSLDGRITSLDNPLFSVGDTVEAGGKTMNISYDSIDSPPLHISCRCQEIPIFVPIDEASSIGE